MIGEILAGVLVGPAVLGWVPAESPVLGALAELGVIFLLFSVGLETQFAELRRVGRVAMATAVAGMAIPFVLGWLFMTSIGQGGVKAVFIGTAMVATSVGVTARVLRDKKKLGTRPAQVILAAAVADDILSLILLGVVSGSAKGSISVPGLVTLAVGAVAFVLIVGTVGRAAMRRLIPHHTKLKMTEPMLGVAIAVALILAASSEVLGLAGIVGAFLAGLVLGETEVENELQRKLLPLSTFLVPFFFVYVGAQMDLGVFRTRSGAEIVIAITALAIFGKLIGCGLASLKLGRRSALIVGIGMIPRGEVGIIVASLGLAAGVIDRQLFAVVVMMSILTTLVVPPLLSAAYPKTAQPDGEP